MTPWTAVINGLTIGAGTAYRWATMPEGFGMSDYRSQDAMLPRQDGVVAGDDRLSGRMITFDVHVIGATGVTVEQAANALKGAFAPRQADVTAMFNLAGGVDGYTVFGRPRSCPVVLDKKFMGGVLRARCSFWATDPRLFGAEVTTVIALPSGVSGLLFPASAPFVFGLAASPGSAVVTNGGTYATDWSATLSGPLTSPQIEHLGTGRLLGFTSLTIASGETLILDSRTKTALLNGTSSRYSSLSAASRWFDLPVGASTIRFTAASGSGSVDFRHRPAYL